MMTAMMSDEPSSIRTRPSLLGRLKAGDDAQSWEEFYRIYGKLVRDFALQAGLSATEADEVVQETVIATSRHLPEFQYDPKKCRFKTWLLNQTSWRIKDQITKRRKESSIIDFSAAKADDTTSGTAGINQVPDPAALDLETVFETQWQRSLYAGALERVKAKFNLRKFQIFDLAVTQEWPAAEVAKSLGVTLANVYVIKHRVSAAIAKEINRLEKELERQVGGRDGAPARAGGGRFSSLP
jgi:RNA polymerase sigma-70 factor (ECF subfamily)